MKKILFLVLAMVVAFSCQKKELETPNADVEVVFGIQKMDPNDGLKAADPPVCPTDPTTGELLEPAYAKIWITGPLGQQIYEPTVFELNGMLYTQAIKFASADGASVTYTVDEFILFDGNDVAIMATPGPVPALYAEYTTIHVPFTFTVEEFAKKEVPVEVICYLPENHDYFGFTWFEITEIVVREFCFFGDICLNGEPFSPADFNGSLYGTNLGVDIPAIIQIIIKDASGAPVPNSPFNNEAWLGIGDPLCVQYPDRLNVPDEVFTFELSIWLKNDAGWSYQLYHTYTVTDGGILMFDDVTVADVDENGVVEFVVGTCNYSETDHTFPWVCPPNYYQPFDSDDGDWFEYPGPITISGGIATMEEGAFSRFDGYLSVWPGTWTAEVVVYLDPAWIGGEGFDYSVAATGTDGAHQRDFIFHVSKDISEGKLFIGGSNNSNFATRQDLETMNNYEITVAGYYTLQHVFYDAGGYLAVDLNLVDGGSVVWTETREAPTLDLIPSEVGGNRYGWFTFIDVAGGVMVDEASLIRDCNN